MAPDRGDATGRIPKEAIVKAVVDRDLCIGCSLCVDTCPEVFAMGDDNLAYTIGESVPPDQYDCVREAAEICPVEAISSVAE